MTTATNWRPAGYHTITPYIMVKEAERFIDFLKEAFDATETFRSTGSAGGLHAELRIGDSMLMVGGAQSEEFPATIYLYVRDTDETYQRAVKAGATSVNEPKDQSYGDRSAWIKDAFGNTWFIATHLEQK